VKEEMMQARVKQRALWKRFVGVDRTHRTLSQSIIIIRALVACVFLSEGIQKFLFSDALGVGRFIKIGIPSPAVMAPFVGIVEIVCGGLLLLGLFTRLAAIPLIINMLVAISTTKIPILLEKGFWAMAHEARVDWSMVLGSIFLLIVGSGGWSLDDIRDRNAEKQNSQEIGQ
jgi:putative oxidoreductase